MEIWAATQHRPTVDGVGQSCRFAPSPRPSNATKLTSAPGRARSGFGGRENLLAVFARLLPRFALMLLLLAGGFWPVGPCRAAEAMLNASVDLAKATVVVRSGVLPPAERTAARVLVEEIERRTGVRWHVSPEWPKTGAVVAIESGSGDPGWPVAAPLRQGLDLPELRPEGFRLVVTNSGKSQSVVWITGADGRGALFGVGQLLRSLEWGGGTARLAAGLDIATSPAQPIRGHQLGYRHTANSYDGWDDRQFEQYIRELALFGANSVEGIPFQDERKSPLMPMPRAVMNRRLSEICAEYDMDYWIWAPADFDLNDTAKRVEHLARHEALFRECPRFDAVFFPGGDPGNNPPELVMPYLEDLAQILAKSHPKAKIWLSLQGFDKTNAEYVYKWIEEKRPEWLGGLVAGPSSPPLSELRARLPRQYGLRDYPDITHTVRCQYPTVWWDPAFALTLGRESANPRPVFYKGIVDHTGPSTSGFISYSDGVHDDVNKTLWSRLAWEPQSEPRDILLEYTRCFFGARVAETAADGILALERNWDGPLAENGGVEATLTLWQKLEREAPELRGNWRWQLCLLRAYYDAYTRHRLLYEAELEREANRELAEAGRRGGVASMTAARGVLERAVTHPVKKEWRSRIVELCAELFDSIKLQTSVPVYHASGYERGAVLDFVDYPLNNRWWLEDEFTKIGKLPDEAGRLKALDLIRSWETPRPGAFYDEVGNIAKSPHVIRGEGLNTDPHMTKNPNPGFWWWDDGFSRKRLSWQTSMDWPLGLLYERLASPNGYRVRLTGYGTMRLRANGEKLSPLRSTPVEIGEFVEFEVPAGLIKGGKLVLTFDPLPEEARLNWRKQSRVSEVWLLRNSP